MFFKNKYNSLWKIISDSWNLLIPGEKIKMWYLMIIKCIALLLDTISTLGVMPLIALIIEPKLITEISYVKKGMEFIGNPSYESLIIILTISAITFLILGVGFRLFTQYQMRTFGVSCQNRLSGYLLEKLLYAPYVWFLDKNSSALAHLIYTDVLMWSNDSIQRIVTCFGNIFILIISIVAILLAISVKGFIGLLLICIIAYLLFRLIRHRLKKLAVLRRSSSIKMAVFAKQIFAGVVDIKLSTRNNYFIKSFIEIFYNYGITMVNFKFLQMIPSTFMQVLGKVVLIIIAFFLWKAGFSGGEIAVIIAIILVFTSKALPAITNLASELNLMLNAAPHVEGIYKMRESINNLQLTNMNVEVEEKEKFISKSWNQIRFHNVSYKYPGTVKKVLNNINILLERGKSYGIAGASGAGKTTLINLFLGLLDVTEGNIYINQQELSISDKISWFQQSSYVQQTPTFIDDTLRANVAFGFKQEEVDDDYVMLCLKKANLEDVLSELPDALDTMLGDRGVRFSGGQLQRIALARALYDRPELLILDEATSALDSISELAIKDTINSLNGQITTIIVAHRLSTIQDCDKIFVFNDGQLISEGSYNYLLKTCPLFMEMVRQFASDSKVS